MEHRHLVLAYAFVLVLQFGYAAYTWARWRSAAAKSKAQQQK